MGGTQDLRKDVLEDFFSQFGIVELVKTLSKGYGFITFTHAKDAVAAYQDGYRYKTDVEMKKSRQTVSGVTFGVQLRAIAELKVNSTVNICDMIKRNESDVGGVVFEILAKTVF